MIPGAISLLAAADIAHQGTVSFNQACAMNPACTPVADPSGALTTAGVAILILGLILTLYGGFNLRKN